MAFPGHLRDRGATASGRPLSDVGRRAFASRMGLCGPANGITLNQAGWRGLRLWCRKSVVSKVCGVESLWCRWPVEPRWDRPWRLAATTVWDAPPPCFTFSCGLGGSISPTDGALRVKIALRLTLPPLSELAYP